MTDLIFGGTLICVAIAPDPEPKWAPRTYENLLQLCWQRSYFDYAQYFLVKQQNCRMNCQTAKC